jgi:hypothetical protein
MNVTRENRGGVNVGIVWMSAIVLAVGVLFTSIAGRAQTPGAQLPQAKVRELATLDGDVNGDPVLLPSGRALIYTPLTDGATQNLPRVVDSTFAYEIATKHRMLLWTNMLTLSVSPRGDRLAFARSSEDGMGVFGLHPKLNDGRLAVGPKAAAGATRPARLFADMHLRPYGRPNTRMCV